MQRIGRNNLDRARSPYLRQHRDNPVHWQEWSRGVLEFAKREDRPLFVSVGYSTCHWCHVMAREAFSDPEIAEYLNENFVSIKVDREERPDIDQYLMKFLIATTGNGGWPMNAFLSPQGAPFFALTYAPVKPRFNMLGFLEILKRVRSFYDEKKGELQRYEPDPYETTRGRTLQGGGYDEAVERIRSDLYRRYDNEWAGFEGSQKFPPHAQLLYLLQDGAVSGMSESHRLAEHTLDTIYLRGLHDHLQGGFFRYCVDREWTIPHFEKMLYDQALLLWSFSWGYRVLKKQRYRRAIEGIFTALEETFAIDGVYAAGLDADTDHQEGKSYLWSRGELEGLLTNEELEIVESLFESAKSGNFEGKLHLVAMREPGEEEAARGVLDKLLRERSTRPQPERDEKIVTSWNALAGVGLAEAWRATGETRYLERAEALYAELVERNRREEGFSHSSISGKGAQEEGFLEDAAAVLLLETYLYEDGLLSEERLGESEKELLRFKEGENWHASKADDFVHMPSEVFDSPVPAAASLAEMALLRYRMLLDEEYEELSLAQAFQSDFYNLAARFSAGELYLVKAPEPPAWDSLPFPALRGKAERENYCFRGVCYFGLPKA
ncbi:MAG: thioredoxin domain-containing protein [Alkalispirochaetaceae bacterium]